MPVWSPDGHAIYFTRGQRIIDRVPADGSTAPQTIFQAPHPLRLHATSITPDGKRLLAQWDMSPVAPKVEHRVVELGPTPKLTTLDPEPGVQSDGQLSRDGRWLLLRRVVSEAGNGDIYALPAGDSTLTPLLTTPARESSPILPRWRGPK
jgi:Tol biopolymer transport system component